MKKLIFASLLFFSVHALFAQLKIGLSSNFLLNAGTTCEEKKLNESSSAFEKLGYEKTDRTVTSLGFNCFARYQMSFHKKLGAQLDFSYIASNGIKREFSDDGSTMSFQYDYQSLELAPLFTYDLTKSNWNLTFFAGPNFSFPIEKIYYKYNFIDQSSDEFELKSNCIPGILAGIYAGYRLYDWELFLTCRYTNDFLPVKYESNGQTSDLLLRRCLSIGLGFSYSLFSKNRSR